MRDPEIFKYDIRVRERMLRAGRITPEEVNELLQALPDGESGCEEVLLPQPALDLGAASAAPSRQAFPSTSNETTSAPRTEDEVEA